jgi:molecular chaperone DnaK
MNSIIYGIDLGTTYSAITYVHPHKGQVEELIRLEETEFTMPSAVLFLPQRRVKVGRSAIENSWKPDTRLAVFAKRDIGTRNPTRWKYEGWEYEPEDISALILRKIARVVQAKGYPPVRQVVVTHPQYFGFNQKEATKEACELAGLEPIATLTEPHAAAIFWGAYETVRREQREMNVLVFDLGGGTLDVTIMHLTPTSMRILASDGNSRLGGIDWDKVIIDWVKEEYRRRTGQDPDVVMTDQQRVELQVEAEKVKRKLSQSDEIRITADIGEDRVSLVIRREEFEARCESLVNVCLGKCEQAVRKAGLSWDQIDKILPVGSSTRMPMIQKALRRFGPEVCTTDDPKGVVAKGAALWGYLLTIREATPDIIQMETPSEPVTTGLALPEVKGATAHGIGVLVEQFGRRLLDIIIPMNTPTPHEIEKTYVTTTDNATRLEVPIYEGDSSNPDEGVPIGKIVIDDLPPRPKGQPVRVYLKVDVAGRISVEVIDEKTGRRVQKTIDRSELRERPSGRLSPEERKKHLDQLIIED